MSAFALPMPPGGLTALPSSAYGTLRYRGRRTEDGRRRYRYASRACRQNLQLLGDDLIFVSPISPGLFIDIAKIERIARPNPHLIRRSDRHPEKAFELRFRLLLTAVTFGNIGTDGLLARRI